MDMNSSLFIDLVEPTMRTVFDGSYRRKEPQWSQIFKKMPGQKARFHESTMLFGFGLALETGEGVPVSSDQGGISYRVRMVFRKYALSFGLTEEMMDDIQAIDIAAAMSRHLATSMWETAEVVHVDVLNRSQDTSYLGGDGVTLLNTAHPKAVGGTYSNRLTSPADLSEGSLEQLLIQIDTAVDDRGNRIDLSSTKLIVPPELKFDALRILRATLQTGTNSNDPNVIRSIGALPDTPTIMTRLTLANSYFIQTDIDNGLVHYDRYGVRRKMEGDFETGNMRFKSSMRFVCGWEDARGIYGSHGI